MITLWVENVPRIKREHLSYILEFDYVIEKSSKLVLALLGLVIIAIVPGWVRALTVYFENYGLTSIQVIGVPLVVTVVMLLSLFIAFVIPHFEPTLQPKGFRSLKETGVARIYLTLIVGLLGLTILSILLLYYYMTI